MPRPALDTPGDTYFDQTGTTLTIAARQTASTGTVTIAARNDGIYGPASRHVRVSGDAVNERAVNGPAAVDLTITDGRVIESRCANGAAARS